MERDSAQLTKQRSGSTDCEDHDLDVLKRGYEALDDVAERLGYKDQKEMIEQRSKKV